MSPSDIISLFLIGVAVFIAILFVWFTFRKRPKPAIALIVILVTGYIGYILYYPTLKIKTHAKRYEQITDYLVENYPDKEFNISPKQYEAGYRVGEFNVNDIETPTIGVMFRVDDKAKATQISSWSSKDYPKQQELWREIEYSYGEPYTLDKDIADITKEDEWIKGVLTAFALTIDGMPAIALFNYSEEGYGLLDLQQGDRDGFVVIEEEGFIFIYADERYERETVTTILKNGNEITLNIAQQKGRLIVETQQ
ncbi:chloride channel protein [Sporosarcina luteola]|uniref:chloride channel protein n=1 Tax=Sporosarcina luteola TaxID=582850 RepID=UPI0020400728|nr:chloride channel protein [Sporosarcina luteola]MCM3742991.1 chloride channel protein [Sporosarcina luteola]